MTVTERELHMAPIEDPLLGNMTDVADGDDPLYRYLGIPAEEWTDENDASLGSMESLDAYTPIIPLTQPEHDHAHHPETPEDRLLSEIAPYVAEVRALTVEMRERPQHRDFPVDAAPLIGVISRESPVLLDKIRSEVGRVPKMWGSFYLRHDMLSYAVDYDTLAQKTEVVNMHDVQQMLASLYLLAKGDGNIFSLNSFGTFIGVPTVTKIEEPQEEGQDSYVSIHYKAPTESSPAATVAVTEHINMLMRALPHNENLIATVENGVVSIRIKESVLGTSSTYKAGRPKYPAASMSFTQMGGRVVHQFGMTEVPVQMDKPVQIAQLLTEIEESIIPFFDERLSDAFEGLKHDRLSLPPEVVRGVKEAIGAYVNHEYGRAFVPIKGFSSIIASMVNGGTVDKEAARRLAQTLQEFAASDADDPLKLAEVLDTLSPGLPKMITYARDNTNIQMAHLDETRELAEIVHSLTGLVPIDTRRELFNSFDGVIQTFRSQQGKEIPVPNGDEFVSKGNIPALACRLDLEAFGGPSNVSWETARHALSLPPAEMQAIYAADPEDLNAYEREILSVLQAVGNMPIVASFRGMYDVVFVNALSNATDINCDTPEIDIVLKLGREEIDGADQFTASIINSGKDPEPRVVAALNDPAVRTVDSTHGRTGKGSKISEVLVGACHRLVPGSPQVKKYWRLGNRDDQQHGFQLTFTQAIL